MHEKIGYTCFFPFNYENIYFIEKCLNLNKLQRQHSIRLQLKVSLFDVNGTKYFLLFHNIFKQR